MRAPRPRNSELALLRRLIKRSNVSLVITYDEGSEAVLSSTVISGTESGAVETVQVSGDLAIELAKSLKLEKHGDGIAVFSK